MYKLQIVMIALAMTCSSAYGGSQSVGGGDFKSYIRQFIEPTSALVSIANNFQEDCSIRQAPGFVCMDCQVLGRCIYRNSHWETIPIEACDAGQGFHCNSNEQSCSKNPGPCHPGSGVGGDFIFSCPSVGIFPNPFNCQLYHMCFSSANNLISYNILCGGNAAFNPTTSDCSLTTQHSVCQGNQFTCDYAGQMGAWPLNANIYYICMVRQNSNGMRVMFPQLYRCPVGEKFSNDLCIPNGSNGGGGSGFMCTRPGLFPDTTNCRAYYFCDGNLRSQHIMCPAGTYFNQVIYGCVRGNC